jgi:hypothetical protein
MGDLKRNAWKNWLVAAIMAPLIGAFSLADCLSTPLIETIVRPSMIEMIVYGIAIAQLNLIAIWTALAPGNIVQRWSWTLLLMVWSWYSYTIGLCWWDDWFGLSGPMRSLQYALVLGYTLVIGFLAALLPLGIVGNVFGWRLVNSATAASPSRAQFNLRHLLWAMVATALIVVPGRFIVPPEGRQTLEFDGELAIVLTVLAVTNLFIFFPALWLAFSKKRGAIINLLAGIGCCAIITFAEFWVIVLIWGPAPDPQIYFYFLFGIKNVTQFGIIYATLWLFRGIGFQLIRQPRKAAIGTASGSDGQDCPSYSFPKYGPEEL